MNQIALLYGEGLGLERFVIPKIERQSKTVPSNVVNLFGETNEPTASDKWNSISDELKHRIVNNIFCVKCGLSSLNENYTIHQETIGISLHGTCYHCDSPVVRLIEEE